MNNDAILNSIFKNTQNSYKFFWWLAIMELVIEKDEKTLTFDEIVIKLITKMWYPINYFKLSFGKQDKVVDYINDLKEEFQLDDNIIEIKLLSFLRKEVDHKTIQRISQKTTKYVPYRFIRPWYTEETRNLKDYLVNDAILNAQTNQEGEVPYLIDDNKRLITINTETKRMIENNYGILQSFTLFKLTHFLEKRNPSVPNISIKLSKPNSRSLNKATKLWKHFISLNPEITDIFELKKLQSLDELSIDHFLPWSYFSHDEIWNTHPINKRVNSSKNNVLPSIAYLTKFCKIQFEFLQYIISISSFESLNEYCNILSVNVNELKTMNYDDFSLKFKEAYLLHFNTAINMGFASNWKFYK